MIWADPSYLATKDSSNQCSTALKTPRDDVHALKRLKRNLSWSLLRVHQGPYQSLLKGVEEKIVVSVLQGAHELGYSTLLNGNNNK